MPDLSESPARTLARFQSLIVVAPHPDDDVIGCGGTIAAAAAQGLPVRIVYVTDGAASHVGSSAFPARRLAALREDEARSALAILGVTTTPVFLRWPDGSVPGPDAPGAPPLLAALASTFVTDGDALVLAPWRRDPHPDHRAVAALVQRACAGRRNVTCAEYAVWLDVRGADADRPTPEEGTPLVLDVSAHVALKRAALAAHRSQLGELVLDASEAFVLPPALIAAAAAPAERFVLVA